MSPRSPIRRRRNLARMALSSAPRNYGLRPESVVAIQRPLKRGHDEHPSWAQLASWQSRSAFPISRHVAHDNAYCCRCFGTTE
jgi:hypothetical protein